MDNQMEHLEQVPDENAPYRPNDDSPEANLENPEDGYLLPEFHLLEQLITLKTAVEGGDIETLSRLLVDEGKRLTDLASDDLCSKLLIEAVEKGYFDAGTLLVSKGAPVNCRSESGWTPLHVVAGEAAAFEVVKCMLEHGADVNAKILVNSVGDSLNEEAGHTPLHRAALNGNLKAVELLLQYGADCNMTNSRGISPIILAMKGRWTKITKILLDHGVDVHQTSIDLPTLRCLTPLDWAMSQLFELPGSDHLRKVVQNFLNWETDNISTAVTAPTEVELPLSDMEGLKDLSTIIELLVQKGALDHIIIQAIKLCHPDVAYKVTKTLIKHGADVNAEDDKGKTPLLISIPEYVSSPSHLHIIEYLLDQGARINVADANGDTPLSRALVLGDDAIVKLLLDRGAEVNTVNSDGDTPLHMAVSFYGTEGFKIIKMLLDKGAVVDVKDSEGNTPLMVAVTCCYWSEIPLLLINHGADLNARNSIGLTPFKLAVIESKTSVISQLLVNKVQFDPEDLLEDELLVRLIIDTVRQIRKQVLDVHRVHHREDILKARKKLVDSCIKLHHAGHNSRFRGRAFLALSEGLRTSPIDIKCITESGSSTELLFTIVESRVLDLKLKKEPVPESHLKCVLSYRIKDEDDDDMKKTYNMMCNKEIRRMKLYWITDSVRLHEIITEDPKKAAAYARNGKVRRNLLKLYRRNMCEGGVQQFPIFSLLINNRIQNVLARFKLVSAGQYSLNSLFHRSMGIGKPLSADEKSMSVTTKLVSENDAQSSGSQQLLPTVVTDAILDLLDDQHLQNLIAADCNIETENIEKLHAEWEEDLLRMISCD